MIVAGPLADSAISRQMPTGRSSHAHNPQPIGIDQVRLHALDGGGIEVFIAQAMSISREPLRERLLAGPQLRP